MHFTVLLDKIKTAFPMRIICSNCIMIVDIKKIKKETRFQNQNAFFWIFFWKNTKLRFLKVLHIFHKIQCKETNIFPCVFTWIYVYKHKS